jgi:glycosyltransferase involved in cell wall biosynthesis
MDLTVTLEARYSVAPDGSVWAQIGMAHSFWERYLEVFNTVKVVARGTPVMQPPTGWLRVDGDGVVFHCVPDYCGPWEYLKRRTAVQSAIRAALPASGAVILRVGSSQIANILAGELHHRNYPYAVEVIGDPYEVFAPGVVDHPFRPLFRWHFSRRLRQQCLRANGAAYVTRATLQARYPSRSNFSVSDVDLTEGSFLDAGSAYYSNVELNAECITKSTYKPRKHGPFRLVSIGSLEQMYKGMDVLIDAMAQCLRGGVDVTAVIVGDGKFRPILMAQTERLGLASHIQFAGWVTAGEPVRQILDEADLFVLASRTEGLPRAMVEAMARARPCIGSNVGGIPELLDASEMVPADDSQALADKIIAVLRDSNRMEAMSRLNLERSREYCDTVLNERRRRFYEHVRDFTREWGRTHRQVPSKSSGRESKQPQVTPSHRN